MKIPIRKVIFGERYRRDHGDLKALAESIERQGLLQPIGVTPDNVLVFGERRLRACRDILKWDEIDARTVNVTSLVEGEHDENEIRKGFTASERVAIGKAVEAEMSERRGRDNPQNVAELKGKETRQIAAKKAGFGNAETYRQAKTVTEKGIPALVEAMDSGKVSVSGAALIAAQPPKKQEVILSPSDQQKLDEAVRELREAKQFNDFVRSLPPAEPMPDEDREALAEAVGTFEDRQLISKVFSIVDTIAELPDAAEVAERVPFGLEYVIRDGMPRFEAVSKWFDGFLKAWKAKEKTYDAA